MIAGHGINAGAEGRGVDRLGGDDVHLLHEQGGLIELGPSRGPVLGTERAAEGHGDRSTGLQAAGKQRRAGGRAWIDGDQLVRCSVGACTIRVNVADVVAVLGIHSAVGVAVDRGAGNVKEGARSRGVGHIGQVAARGATAEATHGVVRELEAGSRSVSDVTRDQVACEVVPDRVVDLTLELVVEEDRVVGRRRLGSCRAGTDEGGVVDHRSGVVRIVTDRAGHTVPLARAVASVAHTVGQEGGLDREPELVGAGVALVDVERVVLAERGHQVVGVDRATEELEAVVGVREDLDVVDLGAGTDAAQGQAVDLVGTGEDVATVADGNVAEHAAAVGGSGTAVFDHVGATITVDVGGSGRLEAFDAILADVGRAAVVGDGRGTEDDDAAPAAHRRGGRSIGNEGIGVEGAVDAGFGFEFVDAGEDDGFLGGARGIDVRAAGDDQGAELVVGLRGGAFVVEGRVDLGARLDGQSDARRDEDLVLENVGVAFGPGGVRSDCVDARAEGRGVDRLDGDDVDFSGLDGAGNDGGKRDQGTLGCF